MANGVVKSITVLNNLVTAASGGLVASTDMTATGVTAGSYAAATVTVDAAGRVTAITAGAAGGVTSFNTRTGAVTLTSGDVTTALGFTPASASHTHATGDVTGFAEAVDDRVAALLVAGTGITLTYDDGANTLTVTAAGSGVSSFNTRTGAVTLTSGDVTAALGFTPASAATNTGDQFTAVSASRLLGRGGGAGSGAAEELTVGTGLTLSGTTLAVDVGSTVQAWDADLASLAAATGTNTIYFRSGAGTWSPVTVGTGLSFSSGTLAVSGVSVAWSDVTSKPAAVTAVAGLTPAADRVAYYTSSSTAALATLTSTGRNLIAAADAAAARTVLGVVIGTDVQAFNSELAAIAALTGAGVMVRAGTWDIRTRTLTGTGGVAVADGTGASGNPTVSLNVTGLTAETTLADGDEVPFYDLSAVNHRKLTLRTLSKWAVPVGTVAAWYTSTAPAGWLLLDGSNRSRTTYGDLYALWGTTFGVGDGSTTFGTPNATDRALVGAGGTYTANQQFGAATHTLTTGEMPGHTHDATLVAGGAGTGANVTTGGGGYVLRASGSAGGGAHNNVPPSLGTYFIVKY